MKREWRAEADEQTRTAEELMREQYEDGVRADAEADARAAEEGPVAGLCTACGAVEVVLVRATGTRDLSDVGESAAYPTGYGCEVCA